MKKLNIINSLGKSLVAVLLSASMYTATVHAQEGDLNVYGYWNYYGDMSNSLYRHLAEVAFRQLEARRRKVAGLRTREDWAQRQAEVREMITGLFGAFPDKTPLHPVITGRIKRDDMTVEKLYFESRPGYYVTAALFLPVGGKGKKPAILFCSGHSANAFRNKVYQTAILNFVRKGFIVLAFDPVGQGERFQYLDAGGKPLFGTTHEHSLPGSQSFLAGRSPAHYFVWDGIRAIDYLSGRKEVDPSRIGITGRSGGGTQCAYIAALDDRIAAAAPECYLTNFDRLLRSHGPQDAEQILPYALRDGYDMGDLIEVQAPRPLLMITTTRDIFSIQGARETFREAQGAYAAYGRTEQLQMVEDDAGHAGTQRNREATYAFFQKYLRHPGIPDDEEVTLFDEQDLWVTPRGQLHGFLPSETLFSLNRKLTDSLLRNAEAERADASSFLHALRGKITAQTGYQSSAVSGEAIFSGRSWRNGYAVEKYLVAAPGGYYLPLLRLLPVATPRETVLWLDGQDKATAAASGGGADLLAREGYEVIVPDLTDVGELGGGYQGGDSRIQNVPLNVWYAGILTGKSPLAVRMGDIDAVVAFIRSLNTYRGKITGAACGTLTSDLLHAAVTGRYFDKIALIRPLIAWSSLVGEKDCRTKFFMSAAPGVIGAYDLPDLVATLVPQKIWIAHPVDALDEVVDLSVFNASCAFAKEQFERSGFPRRLTVCLPPADPFSELIRWIGTSDADFPDQ
ncbi:MAG: acetylxylan esterase [Tannerella sp.]|nr:acetylxylan esterase [Tannerella sp.]